MNQLRKSRVHISTRRIHSSNTTMCPYECSHPEGGLNFHFDNKYNHSDREITAVYDRYEYDKEKQTAMLAWDRELKKIITNQSKAESKQILTKRKKKTPKKIITKQKKEENNEVITYEQFIKNNKLRDFTKK